MPAIRVIDRIKDQGDFTGGIPSFDGVLFYSHTTGLFSVAPPSAGSSGVSIVSATVPGGFSVNVVNATSTPAINITTSLSGIIKGNGSAFSVATAGTDYLNSTSTINAANITTGILPTGVMPTTSVTPGVYTTANITIDQFGRITTAANGGANYVLTTGSYANPSWITSIPASIISGNLPESQITNLSADLTARPTGVLLTSSYASPLNFTVANGIASGNLVFSGVQPATVLAGPLSLPGLPTFRFLTQSDIPALDASNITTGTFADTLFPNTTVTPGTYLNAHITVDQYGRITDAMTGTAGLGTVTSVSASVPSGFSVNVTNSTTTPAIAITTTLSGVIKGDGSALLAAIAGTDYVSPLGSYANPSWITSIPASIISGNLPESQITNLVSDLSVRPTGILLTTSNATGVFNQPVNFSLVSSVASGNLTLLSQAARNVLAAPTGVSGIPTFRLLSPIDIPDLSATYLPLGQAIPESQVTSLVGDLALKAPLSSPTFTGTPVAPTPAINDNSTKLATTAFVIGQGYASGIILTTSNILYSTPINFSVTNGVASGNLSLITQAPGLVFASPSSVSGTPLFRSLVASDIPNLSATYPTGILLTTNGVLYSTPINFSLVGGIDSGNLSLITQAPLKVFASPTGASGTPTFRSLVAADIPVLDASKITTGVPNGVLKGSAGVFAAATAGTDYATNGVNNTGQYSFSTATVGTVATLTINSGATADNLAATQLNTGADANKGVVVQWHSATQSADFLQLQNNLGTPLTTFDVNGYGFIHRFTFALALGTAATTGNDKTNWLIAPRNGKMVKAFIAAKTAPTGAALICDILKSTNGGTSFATIWSTTANRIQLAAGASTGSQTSFDVTTFNEGDLFRIDIAQIGSTVAGQDITVMLLVSTRNQ